MLGNELLDGASLIAERYVLDIKSYEYKEDDTRKYTLPVDILIS